MKVQNFSTPMLKVNDKAGNPIEVAATVVWQVGDTARGLLAVSDLHGYIVNQTDMALREVASSFPYDSQVETEVTLRGHLARVSQLLGENVQEHVEIAGVRIIEAKFTHLAYAPEIASIMLRRQQATAVVQARETMVEGALGMVHMALAEIDAKGMAKFDDRERAALITNMLTVLLSESAAQPVVAQAKPH